MERTLSIIKPDATSKGYTEQITERFKTAGLKVIARKELTMTKEMAESFYEIHKALPFFNSLVSYMISGPVVIQALEGDNAVLKHREIMGATDPKKALEGTIRKDFGESIEANAVHGSDSIDNAKKEIEFFFGAL
jgi:nucleoside-diphosphate kinase